MPVAQVVQKAKLDEKYFEIVNVTKLKLCTWAET
jgi:hypothetical protein